jgi:hypothetical protein
MVGDSTVNMNISPSGVVTGHAAGDAGGRSALMLASRSDTCWRAQ